MPTPLRTNDLDYHLPEELIATRPAEPRDAARLLVVHPEPKGAGEGLENRLVRDLPAYLQPGDAIVVNQTSVIPARIRGKRVDTGGRVDGLYLGAVADGGDGDGDAKSQPLWHMMLRSNGRLSVGTRIELLDRAGSPSGVTLELLARLGGGEWTVRATHLPMVLHEVGLTPLPPYILRARQMTSRGEDSASGEDVHCAVDALDRRWYQTVFAAADSDRSVAAPTAGLHFTPQLLDAIERQEVSRVAVTLHVGPGTFQPVKTETLAEHRMHSEQFVVDRVAIDRIRAVKQRGGRIFAIGTTTTRVLESLPSDLSQVEFDESGQFQGQTDLLIAPGYAFRHVDGLLTNFHLPRSTLLALVAACIGLDRTQRIYAEAVRQRYRFYSYGDAMLILPRDTGD